LINLDSWIAHDRNPSLFLLVFNFVLIHASLATIRVYH
jgi:hypothetical protein